jgi:uncharacterized protein
MYILQGIMRPRHLQERLARLFAQFPAVCVVGARQVGKSTLISKLFAPDADAVVFDPVSDIENARRDPDLFFDNHPARPLVLDEIQCAPEVVAALKRRIDANRAPGQFLLTGSQQWGVIRALAESLAGRVAFVELEGFSAAELAGAGVGETWLRAWLEDPESLARTGVERPADAPSLYDLLWRGALPGAHALELDAVPALLAGYQRTYVERDVRSLAAPADVAQFSRFFQLASALTAQEVNRSHFGREIGVTPQTAARWLDVLRGTYQWFELPAFHGNLVKRVSSKAKGYFGDTGLACAAQHISSPRALAGHPLLGALFETAVVAELRKLAAALPVPPAFHHWRTAGGAEIDVLLERDGTLYPMEIKLTSRPSRADARGIGALRKAHPELRIAPGLVVAPTERLARISEHDCAMPWNGLVQ